MINLPSSLKDRRLHVTPFRGLLLLGSAIGIVALGASVVLCLEVLIPFASACIQACARDPFLMSVARGAAALVVAVVASGLVVGGVVLAKQITATRKLVRRVESGSVAPPLVLWTLASELGFADRLTYVSDPDPYAFCYGFLSPRICISSGMATSLSTDELRAVVLHEGFHLHQRDPLKVLASRIVSGALYLLPLAAELRDRYLVDKELEADAHVMDESSVQALAGALIKLYRNSAPHSMDEMAAAAVGPFSTMSARIQHLAAHSRPKMTLRIATIVASLAAVGVVLVLTVGSTYAAERSAPVGKSCCGQSVYCPLAGGGSQPAQ
jgi:Zn-dependent protease with chaperone function